MKLTKFEALLLLDIIPSSMQADLDAIDDEIPVGHLKGVSREEAKRSWNSILKKVKTELREAKKRPNK